ncbi:MAG: hypothetical protein ABIO91_00725 [Pyrinomonadaceae bacterium]
MKKLKKNTLKVVVMIALFCPAVFADGEMGGGGLSDSGNADTGIKTVIIRTPEDGEMGGGGRLADSGYIGSVLTSIYDCFDWIV